MQLTPLFSKFDRLHAIHGSKTLTTIYGAGKIDSPKLCLIFMNPTAKNVSSIKTWAGIRAPWLGTKKVWNLLSQLGLFKDTELLNQINIMKPEDWTVEFANNLYKEIANQSIYITNFAKCTQDDARPLSDSVYRRYLSLMLEELELLKPKVTVAFGNQVSSTLLDKKVSVSNYLEDEYEELRLPNNLVLKIYPSYYPVGQGTRNIQKAISRIKVILETPISLV